MDFNDTAEEATFRDQCRSWLETSAPKPTGGASHASNRPYSSHDLEDAKAWQARKADAGYAAIHWPEEHGGRGLSLMHSIIYNQEEAEFDVPKGFFEIGLGICAPPLIAYASDEQKQRLLPEMVRGEEVWCQLFSEPVAGSDLAGIRTRARRDGDEWVVNGQKVWNSGAHYSDWAILVTRHDPTVAKHKGLTFFFLRMDSPGVEVRPIRQISGASNFNEVFLTNVRIPDEQRLGEIGEGWQVALTTLMSERLNSTPRPPDVPHLWRLVEALELESGAALEDSAVREQIADWWVEMAGLQHTNARLLTAISKGKRPGPEASIQKLVSANKQQELSSYGADLQDIGGVLAAPGGRPSIFLEGLLAAPGGRIAAGTDEILKNIIAERVLGLPGDIRLDRDLPFSDIPGGG